MLEFVRDVRDADSGSDHFLLITKMWLRFKRLKQAEKQMIFDTAKLKDINIRFRYQLEVRSRFASLEKTNDIEVRWSNFKDAVYTVADSAIGQRLAAHKKQWISNESWTLTDERKNVKLKRDQADFDGVTETLGRKTSCKLDEKQWIETKCQEAKHAAAKNDFVIPQKIFETNSNFFYLK